MLSVCQAPWDSPRPRHSRSALESTAASSARARFSYAGPGCVARARLAAEVVQERWTQVFGRKAAALQLDLIGLTSCTPWRGLDVPDAWEPPEVRLRAAVQAFDRRVAIDLAREIEALYTNGPAGGGGVETSVRDTIAVISTLVPRDLVETSVEVLA